MSWPHPIGTVVRGFMPRVGIPVRTSCATHLFEVVTEARPVDFGCGHVQSARCLVCDYTTSLLDADWWVEQATPEDFARCRQGVVEEAERLLLMLDRLAMLARGERPVLEDFG